MSYGSFTARYGEKVTVDPSSTVIPTCWLRINSAKNKNELAGGDRIETEALLTLPQARILIASLNAFVDSAEESEG